MNDFSCHMGGVKWHKKCNYCIPHPLHAHQISCSIATSLHKLRVLQSDLSSQIGELRHEKLLRTKIGELRHEKLLRTPDPLSRTCGESLGMRLPLFFYPHPHMLHTPHPPHSTRTPTHPPTHTLYTPLYFLTPTHTGNSQWPSMTGQ